MNNDQLISIDDSDLDAVAGGFTISGSITIPSIKDVVKDVENFGEAVVGAGFSLVKGLLPGISVSVGR